MSLSAYQRYAFRIFGRFVRDSGGSEEHLQLTLERAHINVRSNVYLSYSYLNMVVGFALTAVLVAILALLRVANVVQVPASVFVILIPMPALLAAIIYISAHVLPDLRAGARARDIEAKLPYALNYISIMASAGITLDKVFASLAKQPVYGEIASEAAWISRDLDLLGLDLITALTAAIDRSPSIKFQDFLQGAIINATSGGDSKNYFRTKSEQFAYENRQDQKKFLENLGILAESFVTVVVAAPLFVLVLLSVMTMFGGTGRHALTMGYVMMLAALPLVQAGFLLTVKTISVEP